MRIQARSVLLVLLFVAPAGAGHLIEEYKLVADDVDAGALFGYSVSLDGSTLAVGVPNDDGEIGSVSIWDVVGLFEVQRIPAIGTPQSFGERVSLDGDLLAVGALDGSNSSVHIYHREGASWVHEAQLLPDDGPQFAFGTRIALRQDCLAVGAWLDNTSGDDAGAVYVFRRSAEGLWDQEAKLLASDGASGDRFGSSVAIQGPTLVAGAPFEDGNGFNSGSTYVFQKTGGAWIEVQKLMTGDGTAVDYFGSALALDGDVLAVAAENDENSGSVYVFREQGSVWGEEGPKLMPLTPVPSAQFGHSVSVDGETIAVGMPNADEPAVFVYKFDAFWYEDQVLSASDDDSSSQFGYAVSIQGDLLAVGAWAQGISGAVYLFAAPGIVPAMTTTGQILLLLILASVLAIAVLRGRKARARREA